MSPRVAPSPSSRSSNGESGYNSSCSDSSLASDMQGTIRRPKSGTAVTQKQQTHQSSGVNKDSWAAELSDKIHLVDTLKTFFSGYVPCHTPSPIPRPGSDGTDIFSEVPMKGRETDMYPGILSGLHTLVSGFEPQRRPHFTDGSKCAVRFPFQAWEDENKYTLPDILMSFPGENDGEWAKTWHGISMVCEVKRSKDDDPIDESSARRGVINSNKAKGVLTQLAKSARNIMLSHGMLFVYVVGIYDDMARIYRFDHAACVVSKAFNIRQHAWPLHELLWRLCHYQAPAGGLVQGPLTYMVLGADPTIQPASDEDVQLANAKCVEAGKPRLEDDEKKAIRWVTVATYNDDGEEVGSTRYLLYRVRSLNPRLFSRATVVWDALEEHTWEPCAIKDAWRQLARDREDVFYDRIGKAFRERSWQEKLDDYAFLRRNDPSYAMPSFPLGPYEIDAEGSTMLPPELQEILDEAELEPMVAELYGLPQIKYGDDLGAREVSKASQVNADKTPAGNLPPVYDVYHRTICGWQRGAQRAAYDERSHMRLVMQTVGRPLSKFKSTKELVKALRDAILGHRQAYLAGVIHRDISEDNVMISDGWMSFFVGFLLDFDYGFDWKEALMHAGWPVNEASWKQFVKEYNESLSHRMRPAPPEKDMPVMGPRNPDVEPKEAQKADRKKWEARMKMKERTGTLYFMAYEILRSYVAHDIRHDLESFFWLLLWVILRYTRTTSDALYGVYLNVFGAQDEKHSAMVKAGFLAGEMDWEVKDNEPLTTLVRNFKDLCNMQVVPIGNPKYPPPVALTYESVLALFEEALADPAWPENDRALEFKLPGDVASSSAESGSRLSGGIKRAREDDEDKPKDDDMEDPFANPPPAPKRIHTGSRLRFQVDDHAEGAE